jgi:predicted DNA binding CopG/RHH family protein
VKKSASAKGLPYLSYNPVLLRGTTHDIIS